MNNTVLIIDDSKDVLENTSELLSLSGYKTITASNGKEGVDLARQNKPDLILCDIMMPELDGYGVLRALENMPETRGIPFVFLTAKAEREDFRKGMDLGADDYLVKPYTGSDLLRVVSGRIRKKQMLHDAMNNTQELDKLFEAVQTKKDIGSLFPQKITKKIRKKQMIFMEGDPVGYLYFIVSGKVKLYKSNELGREYIIDIRKDGDFFGYLAMFEESAASESAMAMENTELAMISRRDFFNLFFASREIALRFIKYMSNNLSEAEEKLLKLAYNSARKKVSEALIYMADKYSENGNETRFSLNRGNLSALAGISPESVSRNLSDFKEEGLIEINNGNIHILNMDKLRKLRN